jgi:hypothetical protein
MSIDWKAEYLKSVESGCITLDELREARAELAVIKKALAAQPEPNGWAISYDGKTPYAIWPEGDGPLLDLEVKRQGGTCCKLPIYTTPPAQPAPVPLTDEQIESLLPDDDKPMLLGEAFVKFARLVEAHHGITKGQP